MTALTEPTAVPLTTRHCVVHARSVVNRFDDCNTSATFLTIADRIATGIDRLHEILDNPLMPANVAHHRRTRASVLICWLDLICQSRWIPKIEMRDPVLLNPNRAFASRDLHSARIARICCGSRVQNTDRSVRELQRCHARV